MPSRVGGGLSRLEPPRRCESWWNERVRVDSKPYLRSHRTRRPSTSTHQTTAPPRPRRPTVHSRRQPDGAAARPFASIGFHQEELAYRSTTEASSSLASAFHPSPAAATTQQETNCALETVFASGEPPGFRPRVFSPTSSTAYFERGLHLAGERRSQGKLVFPRDGGEKQVHRESSARAGPTTLGTGGSLLGWVALCVTASHDDDGQLAPTAQAHGGHSLMMTTTTSHAPHKLYLISMTPSSQLAQVAACTS